MRKLIVNADDFGFSRDVNEGIIEAHRRGILTSATIMANAPAFHHAVLLAKDHPTLDIGIHLTLVGERALSRPAKALPRSVPRLVSALARRDLDVERELDSQIRRVLDAGLSPTHLDTHKHTHVLPPVLDALARLAERYRLPWIRRPFDFPLRGGSPRPPLAVRGAALGLSLLKRRFQHVIARHHLRATDHFAGFRLTGRFDHLQLVDLVRQLPVGLTEFMCHPGYCRDELRAANTRLKDSRERELRALCHPEVRQALADAEVCLTNYRELS